MSFLINEDVPGTSHIKFLAGSYTLGRWSIPYLMATMTMKEASRDLRLTKEMPGASKIDWSISELYQREVNWRRVENRIVPYLKNVDHPQFFNALTIALMPYSMNDQKLLDSFESANFHPPALKAHGPDFAKTLSIGPISLGFYDDWMDLDDEGFQMGVMRWNPDEVHAVAIDGQHRLAAIKKFMQSHPNAKARVPVIFLIFDERIGFKMHGRESVTSVLRDIFIDLNKHAEKVMRARQILLDDRDPVSRCVRGLLADRLSDSLACMTEASPVMPLALVDWHSEEAKFHEGPYITSVLQADWIVSRILDTAPIADATDYEGARKQVSALEARLNISLEEARQRIDANEAAQVPFRFTEEELQRIQTTFMNTWNPRLLSLLTEYTPYAELIELRKVNGTLSREWQMWFQLQAAADKGGNQSRLELDAFQDELQNLENPITTKFLNDSLDAIEGLKGSSLAFKVVFQKAYIEAAIEFLKLKAAYIDEIREWLSDEEASFTDLDDDEMTISDEAVEGLDEEPEGEPLADDLDVLTAEFIRSMNLLQGALPGFLDLDLESGSPDDPSRKFWLGTLLKAEGSIDFTQAAAKRAKDLIFMSSCLAFLSAQEGGSEMSFDSIFDAISTPDDLAFWKRLARAQRRLTKDATSTGGRILTILGEDFSLTRSDALIEERLRFIWKRLTD